MAIISHRQKMMILKREKLFNTDANIVLFEGDTREFIRTIPNNFVQLIVTSPPYNIGKEYENRTTLDEYLKSQSDIITECERVLKPGGSICWQVGNYVTNGEIVPLDIVLYPFFEKLNLKLRNRIVWHYGHGLHASKRFSGRYEVILWFTKQDNYIFNLDDVRIPQKYPNKKYFKGPKKGELSGNPIGKNPSDVWDIPNVKANHIEKTDHPCQFPVELIERLVLALTNEGDWVFDPYMGVATTAIALMHRRKVLGAEIVPEYVETSWKRIDQLEAGKLKIRPMERPIYEPTQKKSVPPKTISSGAKQSTQPTIFEERTPYTGEHN